MPLTHLAAMGALFGLLAPVVAAAEPAGNQEQEKRLFDDFDGKLALDWKQVRPDTAHQSLSKHPGKLTITTQYGSIHTADRPVAAKNLFLVDIPELDGAGFVVTTCVEAFQPRAPWNQAGLVLYGDDDNYLKFVCEFSSAGLPILNAIAETEGKPVANYLSASVQTDRLWLKVVKRGDLYECASSSDGTTFTAYADIPWSGAAKQAGVLAKNGNSQTAPDVDANFDFFELRAATEDEKNDPAYNERQKLLGNWKVVSGRVNGKPMADPSKTSLAIRPGQFVLAEGTRSVVATCVVDSASSPKTIAVYMRSGLALNRLNWAYSLSGDDLTLCVTPKPGAAPPTELESTEGDGRMLLNLVRAPAEPVTRP